MYLNLYAYYFLKKEKLRPKAFIFAIKNENIDLRNKENK